MYMYTEVKFQHLSYQRILLERILFIF